MIPVSHEKFSVKWREYQNQHTYHCFMINFYSPGFAQPSGMLQSSGYRDPPPRLLYSGGGGYDPISTPAHLPQQGMIITIHFSPLRSCSVKWREHQNRHSYHCFVINFFFLQSLPHLLVCCNHVGTGIHLLSICIVVVVDTSWHLPHLIFLSKVWVISLLFLSDDIPWEV